jgi:TPR repeat protein
VGLKVRKRASVRWPEPGRPGTTWACLAALALGLAAHARAQDVAPSVVAGIEAYNRGNVADAFHLLKTAADAGDSDAQVTLGYLYARGQGVAQNQQEAMRLYLLSAKQGNPEGMNSVGFKYQYGTGVEIDLPRAVHWFCRAAVAGDPRGLNNLGIMYNEGQGVDRDMEEARNLWRQSAERSNPNAMFNLSQSLFFEMPQDRALASKLLLQSAQLGSAAAQKMLRQLGYDGPAPPAVNTELEMRKARKDLSPGQVRDCGFFDS